MYDRNRSGQVLPFCLISVLSGFPVAGFSGSISGRKILDAGVQVLLSGNIVETSGGTYRANLHAEDINGNVVSFFFTASGCVPVHITVVTQQNVSGRLYSASGVNAVVPIASISGTNAVVPIASISGTTVAPVSLLSGQSVLVYSGQLSGQPVSLLSGRSYTASGIFATATATVGSGDVYLASGHNLFYSGQLYPNSGLSVLVRSGQLSGQLVNILSGNTVTILSGTLFATLVSGTTFLASGQAVLVYSGQLSGHRVDLLSGRSYTASGIFGTATATVGSGDVFLASGHNLFYSGQLYPNSGLSVLVRSGQLSGHAVDLLSGRSYTASGIFAVATATVASGGVYLASGHFLFGSGQFYLASGHQAVLYSGQSVNVNSGQLSGHAVDLLSGRSYTASGIFATATATVGSGTTFLASGHNLFYSGQLYPNSGLTVLVASGQLSGHAVNLLSGRSYTASGIFATAAVSIASGSLSGQLVTLVSGQSFIASGHNAVVPIASISGTNAVVPITSISGATVAPVTVLSGQLSGHAVDLLSGRSYTASGIFTTTAIASGTTYLASGHPATLYSGQVVGLFSGQQVAVVSGTFVNTWSGQTQIASGAFVNATATVTSGGVFLASGSQVIAATVLDKSGYTLSASGLDTVPVEAGMNARQAMAIAAAAMGGRLSGAGTTAVRIDGANASGTNRIAAVVDASGNRTSVILTLPG